MTLAPDTAENGSSAMKNGGIDNGDIKDYPGAVKTMRVANIAVAIAVIIISVCDLLLSASCRQSGA